MEGAKEISKEEFIKWATEYQQRKINNINSDYTQLFKHINSIPDDGKEHLVSDLCGEQFCFNMFRTNSIEVECYSFNGLTVFPEVWSLDPTEAGF